MSSADEYTIKPGKEHLPVERTVFFSGDEFGDLIRRRRLELGLSLRQLQDRTGVHNSRLSRWERGEQRPEHADLLTRLADALDLPLAQLCDHARGHLGQGLPEVAPYLCLKYGERLPAEVIDELSRRCQAALDQHDTRPGRPEARPIKKGGTP